jgi:predicted NAD-dependent protein-ADP-ribosyltransferase YbiA (DUF1768 family)
MKPITQYQRKLKLEYSRAQKSLILKFKRRQTPSDAKALIRDTIKALTARQSKVMAYYIIKSFLAGERDARNEFKGVIKAAAPGASIEFGSITDPNLKRIVRANIGAIGDFNIALRNDLIKQYDKILGDNKLHNSLARDGWTPWLDESLKKRGISPEVISLIKHQKTTAKMLSALNDQGIRGGMHPNQAAKRLIPHINRYFGPKGVEIDNIGKIVKQFRVDADGNYGWFDHKVSRKYRATPKTYSRLIAQNAMKEAHRDAYYRSVQKTGLVDHFISISVMDARTCANCAAMHGRRVSKADGPSYHSMCHCDLKPVWKRKSVLADKNRSDKHYERQRDLHFMRLHDLKRFNETMPSGSKLKHYALLPENALTYVMPGPLQMQKIRHSLMGEPAKIAPISPHEMQTISNAEWQAEAKTLFGETKKDGVEHMALFNVDGTTKYFKGTKHEVSYMKPTASFSSIHTHPSEWDSPLSEQDFLSFLTCKNEVQMAATSDLHIYVITKLKGSKTLTTAAQKRKFLAEFKEETNSFFRNIDTTKYSNLDYHYSYLRAGKKMATRYKLTYDVILRTP